MDDVRSSLGPTGDRDLVLFGLLVVLAGLLLGAIGCLMVASALTCWLVGAPGGVPAPSTWLPSALRLLFELDQPGKAFREPVASAVTTHSGLYWMLAVTTELMYTTSLVALGRKMWRVYGPTPRGHASRGQVRSQLSPAAARRAARWTRPSLNEAERKSVPIEELAAPLHRGPTGRMWVPFENPTGTIAPTQSGKTRRDLIHKALDAPGALLCSTTKADLIEMAGLARTRRDAGPVLVYDATNTVAWPAQLRWSPIIGCEDPAVAYRRARAMVEAAAVAVEAGGHGSAGNDRVFRERATMVLSAYFLAAALSGSQIEAVIRWATEKPLTTEPARILEGYYPAWRPT